ncbi:hypothetical protein HDU91_000747, partial [Kappamyces sp. JEL0680]
NLDPILQSQSLTRLRTLILHGCAMLEGTVVCECQRQEGASPDSASLPEVKRIRDKSYMSPAATVHLATPLSPTIPELAVASGNAGKCPIQTFLRHLEIVDCEGLDQALVSQLLHHCVGLKRFIFAGSSLDSSIRKTVLRRPGVVASIYALTPSSPDFE